MSISYSPNGTYPTFPIILPQDGEIINETILTVGILEPLVDAVGENCTRTYTVEQRFDGGIAIGTAPTLDGGSGGDSDQTLDVSKPFWNLAAATVLRTDTLRSTTAPIPEDGQVLDLRMEQGGAASRRIVREGGTIVCTLGNDANDPACARVRWNGTVWKLMGYSAHVTPGPGA